MTGSGQPRARPPSRKEFEDLQAKLDGLASQVKTLSDTLTQPGPGGTQSIVEMWRQAGAEQIGMDYLARRLRAALQWAAALASALGLALVLKSPGVWPGEGQGK